RPDGTGFDRARLDGDQTGMSALSSLYETADGWIAVVAPDEARWAALKGVLGAASLESADFASVEARRRNGKALPAALRTALKGKSALAWGGAREAAGVPAGGSAPTFGQKLHDTAGFRRGPWRVGYRHELVGWFEQMGLLFDFSETPGVIQSPPLVVGE